MFFNAPTNIAKIFYFRDIEKYILYIIYFLEQAFLHIETQ